MLSHYVYSHIRPDTGEVFYIGKGSGNRAWHNYDRNDYWWRIANKCGGQDSIKVDILASGLYENEAYNFENVMIKATKTQTDFRLCNMNEGGKGGMSNPTNEVREKQRRAKLGRKLSEEHKNKIGVAHLGMKRPKETGIKISAALTGLKRSDATKEKCRIANLGKKHSQEFKDAMSKRMSGENHPMYGKSHTKEAIEKMSISKIGNVAWNKGRPHTEEHKAALKAAWVKRKERAEK
jgi:hypothetical protein